ncbi:hypothetical protein F4678DRAFT_427263, partial [Xylaria arbuscula]
MVCAARPCCVWAWLGLLLAETETETGTTWKPCFDRKILIKTKSLSPNNKELIQRSVNFVVDHSGQLLRRSAFCSWLGRNMVLGQRDVQQR